MFCSWHIACIGFVSWWFGFSLLACLLLDCVFINSAALILPKQLGGLGFDFLLCVVRVLVLGVVGC